MSRVEKKLQVLFVDDVPKNIDKWSLSLEKAAPSGTLDIVNHKKSGVAVDIRREVECLLKLRKAARSSKPPSKMECSGPFDEADIVIVDYDLMGIDGMILTGEEVAYLLRCFSKCGLIVLLNPPEFGTNFFDLGLRRPMTSWADFALGELHLKNQWLWRDKPSDFSPWSWPTLPGAVERRRRQVREIGQSLDVAILDMLALPPAARIGMDPLMAGVVSTRGERSQASGAKVKRRPEQSLRTGRSLVLEEDFGVHRKDRKGVEPDKGQIARIAAARVSSWLENVVLPAQSVLVDAPHLVVRLPSLLSGDPGKMSTWARTATRDVDIAVGSVKASEISQHTFSAFSWLSRPAWYWPAIAADPRYIEWARTPGNIDFVFCEDTSTFARRSGAHEFVADVPQQFARRYVKKEDSDISYSPSVRLSM